MLVNLKLINFRKHEDLTIDFEHGLNAIRGANEDGKTTIVESITYAWFGANSLRSTLAKVVTYGKPETTLKVELTFTVSGIEYMLKRSKAGAELTFGEDSVTGQKEVTRYVERLLGCSADVATKLMLANQSKIKGALEEGDSGAVKLIETLADFDLIDQILQLVEAHLPSGNTKIMESRVAQLKLAAAEEVSVDLAGLEQPVSEATATHESSLLKLADAKAALEELAIVESRQILADHARLTDKVETLQKDLKAVDAALVETLPEVPDMSTVTGLRGKAEAQKTEAAALALRNKLLAAKIEPQWEGNIFSLEAEIAKEDMIAMQLRETLSANRLKLNTLQGQIISDTTCKLCQKDLKDVPEVQLINNKLYPEVEACKLLIEHQTRLAAEVKVKLDELQQVLKSHSFAQVLYAECSKYIELDHSTVPAVATWVGPTCGDFSDYASQIAALEASDRSYQKAKTTYELNTKRKAEMAEALQLAQATTKELPVEDAADTIRLYRSCEAALNTQKEATTESARVLAAVKSALGQAVAVLQEKLKRQVEVKADLLKSEIELDEMIKNNNLVKKLRGARPQIATKLWQVVLGSVSHYFSQMRGVASVVTKDDSGFLVNGQEIAGLSGSTLDILGLAIRVALTRTFLPNVQLMSLDEPAAACDEDREIAMLGLITSCNFDQILLVTHSQLADVYAAKVITLGEQV